MSGNVIPIRGHGRPIARAYLLADMETRCDTCGAEPHRHCRRVDGQVRRVPCLTRLTRAGGPSNPAVTP
jgi:hypothetical protein